MKTKLSLSLDDLHVESFTTSAAPRPTGTVQGYATDAATCTQGGNTCATDNVNTWCCWDNSDTTCPGGGGGDNTTGCGGETLLCGSHAPSCGATCQITGIPYKCGDGCGSDW